MYVSHLESALDGTKLPAGTIQTTHDKRPLWVKYDLKKVAAAFSKEALADREQTMWRYRELLPPREQDTIITLAEGITPLIHCPQLGDALGLPNLLIKDESRLPTGSFKSRGMAMAITMAHSFGITRVALPSAGNAGGAAAAYAARAGMECFVFVPEDTPIVNQLEAHLCGAKTYLVNGLINDCGKIVHAGKDQMSWFDLSTLKEPYRIEGKKTMGLELAEQCHWELPDVIVYPTGGGTGLIGMWKAFQELKEIGWLESKKMPRMVSVQSDGCAPIVRAFEENTQFAKPWENAATTASGLRVPTAVGDFMILDAVRQSNGTAIAAPEAEIAPWTRRAAAAEGLSICPETGACLSAVHSLTQQGWIQPSEKVVVFNTGAVQKYVEAISAELPRLDCNAEINWSSL